ncbi:MAG: DUF4446 family protein [Patescibacteria group bacterium]
MFNFSKKTKKEPENLKEILVDFADLGKRVQEISEELNKLKEKNRFAIQKLGIIRFNPFREVGGDQSFTIAFLDEKDNGAIITSHYSREGNRVYAKPIKEGKSEYSLSEEEISAIESAKKSNIIMVLDSGNKNGRKNSKK